LNTKIEKFSLLGRIERKTEKKLEIVLSSRNSIDGVTEVQLENRQMSLRKSEYDT
jgi:hypothetical protein